MSASFSPAALEVCTEFNFSALPSGQNLFGTVGTTASGLVVIGKTPVLVKDAPGFLVNRVLIPYLAEALLMAEWGLRQLAERRSA